MGRKLKTETNTEAMGERVLAAFEAMHPEHEKPEPVFEHGQWWITCGPCGAQFSACDASGGPATDGFDFEQVSNGDDSCREDT